jgi:hypothetical protein
MALDKGWDVLGKLCDRAASVLVWVLAGVCSAGIT